jgi:hypothetical protein
MDNSLSNSIIYTFTESSKLIDNDGNTLLRFPYSENTYWTGFKYKSTNYTLDIEVILITNDGYTYTISHMSKRAIDTWHDTIWAIPSINSGDCAGIFLLIRAPVESLKQIRFDLHGVMDLYPDVENYILMSEFNTYQFIFSKYDSVYGTIYNVEHPDYIRGVIDDACKINVF